MNIPLKTDKKIRVHNPLDIYQIMRDILLLEDENDRSKEHFWTISLDNGNAVLNVELVSLGSASATLVEPMEVFSIPLQKKAQTVILVHNHPSGNATPSPQDEDITDRLIQVGLIMKVPVIDHIIITDEKYYSFEESGLLAKLHKSTKYVPPYILKERYEKLAMEAQEERNKGKKEQQKEIAKSMLAKSYDIAEIMALTGLTKAQIDHIKE